MQKELKKWLNRNYFWPLGNIVIEVVLFSENYEKIGLLVERLKKILNFDFLFLSSKSIPQELLSDLPQESLALKFVDDSVDLSVLSDNRKLYNFDYLVVLKKNRIQLSKLLKLSFDYMILNSLSIVPILFLLLAIIGFSTSKNIIQFQYLLPFQILALLLLTSLANVQVPNIVSEICSFNSGKNKCIQLKTSVKKILGYFEFHELGIVYFSMIIIINICLGYQQLKLNLVPLVLIFVCLGLLIAVYSFYTQFKTKIYCPICLYVISVCAVQTAIFFHFHKLNFVISPFLFFSFMILLFFILVNVMSLSKYFYLNAINIENENNIRILVNKYKQHMISDRTGYNILNRIENEAFINNTNKSLDKNNLHIFSSLDCAACNIFTNDLISNLDYDNYNIHYYFSVLSQDNTLVDDPNFNIYVVFGYLLSTNSFESYLKAKEIFFKENEDVDRSLVRIYKNFKIPEISQLKVYKDRLINQNRIMEQENIIYFPTIILNKSIIPYDIKPKYYSVLLN